MDEQEIDQALSRLEKLCHDASGWFTLYRDPVAGGLWEISYQHSEMHGGGPRRLAAIALEDALIRYPDAEVR